MLTLYYLMKKSRKKTEQYYDYYKHKLDETVLTKTKNDVSSKCRVCLGEGYTPIYGNDNSTEILQALQTLAAVEISEEDEYSKFLCYMCYKFINAAIVFRNLAKQTDKALRQPIKVESSYDHHNFADSNEYSDSSTCDTKEPSLKWPKEDTERNIVKNNAKNNYSAKVTCHVCNKVINKSYYKEHLTMHDPDQKKYICDVCGKSFRLRCAYHNHSLRHRSDFPYKCQFCPYRGRYMELLKTHLRTHTGDYRYMCTECPARFLFKSNLNSHMLKHKEPQHKCEACKRAFHTKLLLQRHYEADHLGIKNHVCNFCGKAFGYRNAMMKHQRHVHKREKLLFGRMPSYLEEENKNHDDCM